MCRYYALSVSCYISMCSIRLSKTKIRANNALLNFADNIDSRQPYSNLNFNRKSDTKYCTQHIIMQHDKQTTTTCGHFIYSHTFKIKRNWFDSGGLDVIQQQPTAVHWTPVVIFGNNLYSQITSSWVSQLFIWLLDMIRVWQPIANGSTVPIQFLLSLQLQIQLFWTTTNNCFLNIRDCEVCIRWTFFPLFVIFRD